MTRSPTLATLVVLVGVFLVKELVQLVGIGLGMFTLTTPLAVAPWTLVSSVYAHASVPHLIANALALVVFGFAVERVTTPARFHIFFLTAGILAGATEVVVTDLFGPPVAVLGASGAVFALLGYALAGNTLAHDALSRVSQRGQVIVFVLLAAGVTVATASPGVALIAHFTGLVVGLVSGRVRLLHAQ